MKKHIWEKYEFNWVKRGMKDLRVFPKDDVGIVELLGITVGPADMYLSQKGVMHLYIGSRQPREPFNGEALRSILLFNLQTARVPCFRVPSIESEDVTSGSRILHFEFKFSCESSISFKDTAKRWIQRILTAVLDVSREDQLRIENDLRMECSVYVNYNGRWMTDLDYTIPSCAQ